MVFSLLTNVFGSANDRNVKQFQKTVLKINALEESVSALSDSQLQSKTQEFKDRLQNGETEESLLIESFAVVREAAKRVIGLRHYDVQLLGGIVLHKGNIAEMRTGEGKTLVATAPVYLNALSGKGVHVVTVNEYLAKRDAAWMGKVYEFLGLSVGVVVPDISEEDRKNAYNCDITYATNNELGFDFLRDNLRLSLEELAQRKPNFAIVDEVDSILIDEARTPLIISGAAEDSSEMYIKVDKVIEKLELEFVELDEKSKSANLTELGLQEIEERLKKAGLLSEGNLFDYNNISLLHHVNQATKAHFALTAEKDYIVESGEVIIIDEFTGRKMQGRRYGEGLHQAIEAKEGVNIQQENQTLASITFQNYFRMYTKISGMTGTAMTEAGEFEEIYNLQTIAIPTHLDVQRKDHQDEVYRTSAERDAAVIEQVKRCVEKGQPVLLGTASIEKSEHFEKLLKAQKIKCEVLNARNHMKEADIIANAGTLNSVTIATNMAGRGTDIKLGGIDANEEQYAKVLSTGGLYVLGTERHESRRIDNQLRGRSGRQGDVGETKFSLSLEDDLMRIFGSERIDALLGKLGIEQGEAIAHPWVTKALEKAQQKVESHNFEIRKQLIKFDNVTNEQRIAMFDLRKKYMTTDDIFEAFDEMRYECIENLVDSTIPERSLPNQWDITRLHTESMTVLALELPIKEWAEEDGVDAQEIFTRIKKYSDQVVEDNRSKEVDVVKEGYRNIMLQVLDLNWKEHLLQMDHLRQGIGLRAYGQKDPLNEFKSESYTLFVEFLSHCNTVTTQYLSRMTIDYADAEKENTNPNSNAHITGAPKRNAPCTCGSDKKYKHCCGKK